MRAVLLAVAILAWGDFGAAGDLLVASRDNQKILRYDAADGSFVEALVEPVTEGFRTPASIALRPGDGALYVSSAASGEIWRYSAATGQAEPPPTASGLLQPGGIAFDAAGEYLYFAAPADGLSVTRDAVKRLEIASGAMSTLAVDASADFANLAVQGSDVYVGDTLKGQIVRIPIAGGSAAVEITGLSGPGPLLFRAPEALLVAEVGSDRVLEYALSDGAWVLDRVVVDAAVGVDAPSGLALAPDGRLSVSGQFSNNVVAVDLVGLAASELVAPGAGGLQTAGSLAWSGSTLLVASLATNAVLYFDAAGSPTGASARGLSPPVDAGLTLSPSRTLVAASAAHNDLVEYAVQGGGIVRQFFDACPASLDAPYDATFSPDGDLYVSCQFSNSVHHFDALTGDPQGFFVLSGSGGLFFPQGLAFGPDGNLYVISRGSGEVLAYDGADGSFVSTLVAAQDGGSSPVDLTFHGGALYVGYAGSDEVRAFDAADGAPLGAFVTPGSGGLDTPAGLAFGSEGNLFVASLGTQEILEYERVSGAFAAVFVSAGSGGLDGPLDLVFAPSDAAQPVPALPVALGFVTAVVLVATGVWAAARRREAISR